jgi:hypothetical protein
MKDEKCDSTENSGQNKGTRPGRRENLKPWPKGVSGNPGGRPKKTPVTAAYKELIGEQLPDDTRRALKLPNGATWAHALALGQMRSAVKGSTPAAKEITDRIEGRTPQPMELETPKGVEVRWTVQEIAAGKESGNEKCPLRPPPPHIKPEPR